MVRNQNPGPSGGSASEAALGAQLTPLSPGEMTRVHSSAIHVKPPECPSMGTMDTGWGGGVEEPNQEPPKEQVPGR